MTITARHPVRERFAGCSSGPVYYATKAQALYAFDDALKVDNLRLDFDCIIDWTGDEGRNEMGVLDEDDNEVGRAIFTYYRMQSGRWEFVGYLA